MWQEIIVTICVCSAVFFLLHKWFFKKSSSSCGGCNTCEKPGKSSCTQD